MSELRHFQLIDRVDIAEAIAEVDLYPELWNDHPERRESKTSPHRETSDIWLRYRKPEEIDRPNHFHEVFQSVWYPAWFRLRALWPIYHHIAMVLNASDCGGVLMTKIPPGKMVYPHHDRGTWHSEHYTSKVWLPLRANPRCVNYCDDESVVWKPGEAWSHDNLKMHAVENRGDTDRVCLIMCFRCEL
jgi:Aspartyl/Asparaginyl beta-hydroxylase